MMISNVRGQFTKFRGSVDFDEENPEETEVDVIIDASSIDTRNEDRDNHLRSEDFLYVEEYPQLTFSGKRVELVDDEHARLIGDLTICGETNESRLSASTAPVVASSTFLSAEWLHVRIRCSPLSFPH